MEPTWHQRNKEKLAAYKRAYYQSHEDYRIRKRQKALERYYKLKAAEILPVEYKCSDSTQLR